MRVPDNAGMENTAQTSGRLRRSVVASLRGEDPGPEGQKRHRTGYFVAGERVWKRIEIEFSAGATAEWLSVKYGPAVRTIASKAKAGGWRKKDIALKADAVWDAVQDEEQLAEETRAAVREASDHAAMGRAAVKAAVLTAGDEEVDLGRAVLAAQEFVKGAGLVGGVGVVGGVERVSPQDEAALAYVLEKLGYEE